MLTIKITCHYFSLYIYFPLPSMRHDTNSWLTHGLEKSAGDDLWFGYLCHLCCDTVSGSMSMRVLNRMCSDIFFLHSDLHVVFQSSSVKLRGGVSRSGFPGPGPSVISNLLLQVLQIPYSEKLCVTVAVFQTLMHDHSRLEQNSIDIN